MIGALVVIGAIIFTILFVPFIGAGVAFYWDWARTVTDRWRRNR
jgi:hypothetical protein